VTRFLTADWPALGEGSWLALGEGTWLALGEGTFDPVKVWYAPGSLCSPGATTYHIDLSNDSYQQSDMQ